MDKGPDQNTRDDLDGLVEAIAQNDPDDLYARPLTASEPTRTRTPLGTIRKNRRGESVASTEIGGAWRRCFETKRTFEVKMRLRDSAPGGSSG
jgi:hypothetical protein